MENPGQPMEISVVYCDKTYTANLLPTATILDLKNHMKSILDVKEYNQIMVSEKLPQGARLSDQDVLGSVLSTTLNKVYLRCRVQVLVLNKEKGVFCPVTVCTDENVFAIKTFLKTNHGILDAESKKLGIRDPSTIEAVDVEDGTKVCDIESPVAVKEGTVFVLV